MLRLAVVCLIVFAGGAIRQDRFIYFLEQAAAGAIGAGGLRPWPAPQDF
ncbi:hypothetical protein [Paraburkholderia sp. BL6669N2]|nr:hypothetical protein [Paraburkholderia sp. BL6669N2]